MTNSSRVLCYNKRMQVIYLDSLFCMSLLTDYLLCLTAGRLCGLRPRRKRYLAAGLLGAVYAVAVFLPGCAFLALPAGRHVLVASPRALRPLLADAAEVAMLMEALDALNERDRRIIAMRFGLPSGRECTQKEVADAMGISQSYISRLEKRIIDRLRRDLLRRMEV